MYRFPSGGVEGDERPEEALKREVEEEFHVDVGILENFGTCTVKLIDSEEERIFNSHVFLLKPHEKLDLENDDEHEEHLWVNLEELPKFAERLEDCKDWPYWGKFRALVIRYVYRKLAKSS